MAWTGGYRGWIPLGIFLVLVGFVMCAWHLASDTFANVGTNPVANGPIAIAMMRWGLLWAAAASALLVLIAASTTVVWRLRSLGRIRIIVLGCVLLAAVFLAYLMNGRTLGPVYGTGAASRTARSYVKCVTDPLMVLGVFTTVAAFSVMTHCGARSRSEQYIGFDGANTGADDGSHDNCPLTPEAPASVDDLQRTCRNLTVLASLALVLGAAEVHSLFSIPVAEASGVEGESLQKVADAWGLTAGALYSLILAALFIPCAIAVGLWKNEPSTTDSAPAKGVQGLIGILIKTEPILAVIAPFLSALIASVPFGG